MSVAASLWAGAFVGRWVSGVGLPAMITWPIALGLVRVRSLGLAVVAATCLGLVGGSREWAALPVSSGACSGTARLVDDPRSFGVSTSAVVSLHGRRLRAHAYGRAAHRLARMLAGETALMAGTCGPVASTRADRELVSHIVGRWNVSDIAETVTEGTGLHRAANRVRRLFVRGTREMAPENAALFAGLVIGDDRDQSRTMIDQFRRSGLSHLCSVSGQNVVYVLAAFGPFTRRLRPLARLAATLGVIAWFVILTRAEPSVLRASAMATVVAVNFFRGRPMNGRSVLTVAVGTLLVLDPMLAHSVGFLLSAGATAGLAWLSAPLERRGLHPVIAATVAAQAGTLPVSLLVFGRVSLVSFVANPLAVPVAGVVMLLGIPCALLAGIAPDPVAVLLGTLMSVPTQFVGHVARVGAHMEPSGVVALLGWVIAAVVFARRLIRRTGLTE